MLIPVLDRVDLGDKVHWLSALAAIRCLIALNPGGLTSEFRASAEVLGVVERDRTLTAPHATEVDAILVEPSSLCHEQVLASDA
jgi:hypothetical protein